MPAPSDFRVLIIRCFAAALMVTSLAACETGTDIRKGGDGRQGAQYGAPGGPAIPPPPSEQFRFPPDSAWPDLEQPFIPGVTDRLVLQPPAGMTPVTRIGFMVPLSGPNAGLGEALLNAAQIALFDLAGDGFALIPIDTRATPEGVAAAARQAMLEGARLLLGPIFSTSVQAAAPIARQSQVEMIAFSNDRTVAGNGVYILGLRPEAQVRRVLSYARGQGISRIAALIPDGPFGDRVEGALYEVSSETGMEIARFARYASNDTDELTRVVRRISDYDERHKALLDRRKELKERSDEASKLALKRLETVDTLGDPDFEAVLMPEGGDSLRLLGPLMPFHDVDPRKVRMLGTVQWDEDWLQTEPSLFGGWFPAPPPGSRENFLDRYRAAYGQTPPRIAALAYDAVALAAVLVRRKRAAAIEAQQQALQPQGGAAPMAGNTALPPVGPFPITPADLTSPNGFAGVNGIFRLLPDGLSERGLAVMEVRSRRTVVIDPAPTTFRTLGN